MREPTKAADNFRITEKFGWLFSGGGTPALHVRRDARRYEFSTVI
jgi:hypothetical protein